MVPGVTRGENLAVRSGAWNLLRVGLGILLGLVALRLYNGRPFDPNQIVLGTAVYQTYEVWNGRPFTGRSVGEIKSLVADYEAHPVTSAGDCKPLTILWMGNSQLHGINQFQPGNHIAPWWLRKSVSCADSTVPLGMSLPNSNFQELYLIEEYVTARIPVNEMLLELCFDGLRQDGLRDEFAGFAEASDREELSLEPIGKDMLITADGLWNHRNAADQNPGLNGFVQQGLENRLDASLAKVWPLWADRDVLQDKFLVDLYLLRNRILGITPSTVRKLIPPRYNRNMRALEAMLKLAQQRKIPVLGYISPIRQDLPIPYDAAEYGHWKQVLSKLFAEYGARLVNLEPLIPPEDWGYADETGNIDFIHFRNRGHQLVAGALAKYITPAAH